MADPAVAGNPSEFQRVAKAAAELEEQVSAYDKYKEAQAALKEAKELLRDCDGARTYPFLDDNHVGGRLSQLSVYEHRVRLTHSDHFSLSAGDAEMAELAREEINTQQEELNRLTKQLKVLLLPRDPLDEKNIMLEVISGNKRSHAVASECECMAME